MGRARARTMTMTQQATSRACLESPCVRRCEPVSLAAWLLPLRHNMQVAWSRPTGSLFLVVPSRCMCSGLTIPCCSFPMHAYQLDRHICIQTHIIQTQGTHGIHIEGCNLKQHSKGHVAFHDVLRDYTAYLNAKFPLHAWPKAELTQS